MDTITSVTIHRGFMIQEVLLEGETKLKSRKLTDPFKHTQWRVSAVGHTEKFLLARHRNDAEEKIETGIAKEKLGSFNALRHG